MYVRFTQNVPYSGDVFRINQVVDLDKGLANKFINDGLAVLVTSDPGLVNQGAMAGSGGTINATTIGATTRSTGAFTVLAATGADSSGTPGNATQNTGSGRAAIAAAASSVVITNNNVAAVDHIIVTPRQTDATLTQFGVVPGAGSFTVTGNAAATAAWAFDYLVVKN